MNFKRVKVSATVLSTNSSSADTSQSTPVSQMKIASPQPKENLHDEHIPLILMTLDSGKIDVSSLVSVRTKNIDIKNYAQYIVFLFMKNNKNSLQIIKDENIKPLRSHTSRSLKQVLDIKLEKLRMVERDKCDITYLEYVVSSLKNSINMLKTELIPITKNLRLQRHLKTTLDLRIEQLEHAENLKQSYQA